MANTGIKMINDYLSYIRGNLIYHPEDVFIIDAPDTPRDRLTRGALFDIVRSDLSMWGHYYYGCINCAYTAVYKPITHNTPHALRHAPRKLQHKLYITQTIDECRKAFDDEILSDEYYSDMIAFTPGHHTRDVIPAKYADTMRTASDDINLYGADIGGDIDSYICTLLTQAHGALFTCEDICGCVQGEYTTIYYPAGKYTAADIARFSAFYFNMYYEYIIEYRGDSCSAFITDDDAMTDLYKICADVIGAPCDLSDDNIKYISIW